MASELLEYGFMPMTKQEENISLINTSQFPKPLQTIVTELLSPHLHDNRKYNTAPAQMRKK